MFYRKRAITEWRFSLRGSCRFTEILRKSLGSTRFGWEEMLWASHAAHQHNWLTARLPSSYTPLGGEMTVERSVYPWTSTSLSYQYVPMKAFIWLFTKWKPKEANVWTLKIIKFYKGSKKRGYLRTQELHTNPKALLGNQKQIDCLELLQNEWAGHLPLTLGENPQEFYKNLVDCHM
jgi:hypothetical protein